MLTFRGRRHKIEKSVKGASGVYHAAIMAAGCLWGLIGIFTRELNAAGIPSAGVVVIRSGLVALCFAAVILAKDRSLFRFRWKDGWVFLCFGIATLAFTWCYYSAIELADLAVACTFMYTAPIFAAILSVPLFGERMTGLKVASILVCVAGCALVSGLADGEARLTTGGVLLGIGSGIGYGLYSIFSKVLSRRGYGTLTINVYGWIIAFLLGLAVFGTEPMAPLTDSGRTMVYAGVMVLVSTFSPALLYHWGLSGTDASVGSVLCSVEMIMATGIGYFVFDEKPTWLCALGIVMILAASAGMNLTPRRKHPSPSE